MLERDLYSPEESQAISDKLRKIDQTPGPAKEGLFMATLMQIIKPGFFSLAGLERVFREHELTAHLVAVPIAQKIEGTNIIRLTPAVDLNNSRKRCRYLAALVFEEAPGDVEYYAWQMGVEYDPLVNLHHLEHAGFEVPGMAKREEA